ncbi:MAG: HRDC domain-containing protein [Chitinispirillales bacterium]|jgi:superfamily II DNA helicase RecQ|nr:HRDC domain-containing protein [Chitinispirillales bacterium]
MQIKIFTIPITDTGALHAELNAFLSNHKVLEAEQKFFQNENGAYWSFCIRYITSVAVLSKEQYGKKIDYKEVLSEAEFSIFSKLRVIRKDLAIADAVQPYIVFTDAELAEIVKIISVTTSILEIVSQMKNVKGIGEKKIEKYGKSMVEKYVAL